ncbi:hypothetical protein RJ641_021661 [Dillenia turbinata]|uniref:Mitochondrial import inner membrane translocase subunit TIM14 n=1 Tax=Dillenia turbinata TaxID=194707 RepID=A0AAN8YVX0_9MAGN
MAVLYVHDNGQKVNKDFCMKGLATPFLVGLAVASAALAGRYGIQTWQAFKARPPTARVRKFYEGGFQPTMTRREAALILGIRESTKPEQVKEAHRKVMVANHPDAGGSHYLASKINEAKDDGKINHNLFGLSVDTVTEHTQLSSKHVCLTRISLLDCGGTLGQPHEENSSLVGQARVVLIT